MKVGPGRPQTRDPETLPAWQLDPTEKGGTVRSTVDRTDAYVAKTTSTAAVSTIGLIVASRLPTMKVDFATACQAQCLMQQQVLGILDADGIARLIRGRYFAYANELQRLVGMADGAAATAEAQIIHDKWVGRGALTATLVTIALDVFNLVVT